MGPSTSPVNANDEALARDTIHVPFFIQLLDVFENDFTAGAGLPPNVAVGVPVYFHAGWYRAARAVCGD